MGNMYKNGVKFKFLYEVAGTMCTFHLFIESTPLSLL